MVIDFPDRRREPRKAAVFGARAVFNEKHSTMNCTIRNIGPAGARLRFDGFPLVPPSFELRLTQRDQKHYAHRVWQRGNEMGVVFD